MSVSTEHQLGRAWVEVDLANLIANARAIRRAAHDAALLPMVKANAYGLGVQPVVEALESEDPWGFGVATPDEGGELRRIGVRRPVIVFTPATASQLHACREHDLRPVLDDPALIAAWDRPYHLEIDTGMRRGGIDWADRAGLEIAAAHPPEGVFTHFHSADTAPESVPVQLDRFRRAVATVGGPPPLTHVANSAGAWRVADRFDLVRPGIFLYGGALGADQPRPQPVVSVRAEVVSVRSLEAGESVSYGGEWSAPAPATVVTLSIGYADGIRRSVQGNAEVLVGGARCPVVGRVTMDMTVVDVTRAARPVTRGDVATVIGADGEEAIALDEFAEWAGTISYEVLTGLGRRLPRIYRSA